MKNRSIITMMVVLCLFIGNIQVVFGNSGPSFWKGYPTTDILNLEKDCKVKVNSENLIYDFTELEQHGYTYSARVKAQYKMINEDKLDKEITMAFPFVCSINELSANNINIYNDSEDIPYEIFIGDSFNYRINETTKGYEIDFKEVLSGIKKEKIDTDIKITEKGKLYKFDIRNP